MLRGVTNAALLTMRHERRKEQGGRRRRKKKGARCKEQGGEWVARGVTNVPLLKIKDDYAEA